MYQASDDEKTMIHESMDSHTFPCLEVISGPNAEGRRFPIRDGKSSLGRSAENEICLEDSSVSRRHAQIESLDGKVSLSDMGSRNGTKVGGRKIETKVPLQHGVEIKMGMYRLRYLESEAEEAPAEEMHEPEPSVSEETRHISSEEPPAQSHLDNLPENISEQSVEPYQSEFADASAPPPQEVQGVVATSPQVPKKRLGLLIILVVGLIGIAGLYFLMNRVFLSEKTKTENLILNSTPSVNVAPSTSAETLPAQTPIQTNDAPQLPPAPAQVSKVPIPTTPQPFFLELTSSPVPAQVFFGEQKIGQTPFRLPTQLLIGKWYEVKAIFDLPEIGGSVETKKQFSPTMDASVISVDFMARVGIFKVTHLPREAQLYLEGYFESDPQRGRSVKFGEIVFGKPIYIPYGRYVLELRRSKLIGNSRTYLDEVVYRREFIIDENQKNYTLDEDDVSVQKIPIHITSVPTLSKVFIDDKEVGVTPYKGEFPLGDHQLTVKKEGFADYQHPIRISVNIPYIEEVVLKTSSAGELINKANIMIQEDRFNEAQAVLIDAYQKNPEPRETAQISYMIGLTYLKARQFSLAKDYFQKSRNHEDFKLQGQLGLASVAFEEGDRGKALQLLVEVLVLAQDSKVKSEAGALFQKLSPLKSVFYISSTPPGAKAVLNGQTMSDVTPLIIQDVAGGVYDLVLKKEGYLDKSERINLGVSEFRPFFIKLQPRDDQGLAIPPPETQKLAVPQP